MPPSWGAAALLHPSRKVLTETPPLPAEKVEIVADGIVLKGWRFRAAGERRGTIVYLHGSADNRASVAGVAKRYVPRGYDVLAYDSRAHGDSTGDACTYGYFEKRDLAKAIDSLKVPSAAVIGTSLGAAVALQAAAEDPRIARVVAISTFSDLRTVASERAPFFASAGNIREAIAITEQQAGFVVDEVSPVKAAARLSVPVLLVHGAVDHETPPAHSERVYQALKGPKRLLLLAKSGHAVGLDEATWQVIDEWLTPPT
ncbi:MAG: alpha/beta fold hydrolase [Deltaproteobacteria bacterium]|nr:alpha/beta fold hydrolase [Deltaproteobacteria bacterium]